MYLIGIGEEDYEFRKNARQLIEKMFQKESKEYLIFEFSNKHEMEEFYGNKSCELDVLFLDTILNGESMVAFAKRIKQINEKCQLVFLSTVLEENFRIYEVHHSYHVDKKHFEDRLMHIYMCLMKNIKGHSKKLVLDLKGKKQIIMQQEIQYIERFKRITNIYLVNKLDVIVTSKKLDDLYDELKSSDFVRCHNSYIVNLNFVSSYHRSKFVLTDGTLIPISRKFYEEVKNRFGIWKLH